MGEVILVSEAEGGSPAVGEGGGEVVVAIAAGWGGEYWRSLREWKRADLGKEKSILEGELLVGLWQICSQVEVVTDILLYNIRL